MMAQVTEERSRVDRKERRPSRSSSYRERVWGECANDFRTFLLSQPELPCFELTSG
jgi:hypothetical protein